MNRIEREIEAQRTSPATALDWPQDLVNKILWLCAASGTYRQTKITKEHATIIHGHLEATSGWFNHGTRQIFVRCLRVFEARGQRRAFGARLDVGRDALVRRRVERTVDVLEQAILDRCATHTALPYEGSRVRMRRASSLRARLERDFTVPTGTDNIVAISSILRPWISLSRMISRLVSLNLSNAA